MLKVYCQSNRTCWQQCPLCTELYSTTLRQLYLQQQLWRRVGSDHSGGHGGADSVQLLDLPAPHLDQPRAVPLHPDPAGPGTVHTEGQLRSLCQQSGKTWKDILTGECSFSFIMEMTRVAAYLKGRFDKALVTAHTWLVTSCQPSRKTREIFLQSCRYTRTWRKITAVLSVQCANQLYVHFR